MCVWLFVVPPITYLFWTLFNYLLAVLRARLAVGIAWIALADNYAPYLAWGLYLSQ